MNFFQILFDFDRRFGVHAEFMNSWSAYEHTIENILEMHGAHLDFATVYGDDIAKFLMLLKLLPVRNGGRTNVANRANFSKAIERLIVFAKVLANINIDIILASKKM